MLTCYYCTVSWCDVKVSFYLVGNAYQGGIPHLCGCYILVFSSHEWDWGVFAICLFSINESFVDWLFGQLAVLMVKLVDFLLHLMLFGTLTKWCDLSRLETRTKESNMYASVMVTNQNAQWKWRLAYAGFGRKNLHLCRFITIDRSWSYMVKDLSMSIYVGTRKMVNYAWIGWSQGKLWWKLVAILTCKSIVKFRYRGERLIEPSSSWFPPKFPSG
jgi:hypothetical protein